MAAGTFYKRLEAQRALFVLAGRTYGFPPALLAGIAWNESRGIVQAVNPDSGAAGLMQVAKLHFPALGWQLPTAINKTLRTGTGGSGWNDAGMNINAGASILRDAMNRHGALIRALQGYVGASTMERARSYIDAVLATTVMLAGLEFRYGKWSD